MAVALALIASLCWGVADFMGGSLSRRHPLLVVVLVSQAVGLTGVVVVAAVRSGGYDTGRRYPACWPAWPAWWRSRRSTAP